jgi:hypothetical protein
MTALWRSELSPLELVAGVAGIVGRLFRSRASAPFVDAIPD